MNHGLKALLLAASTIITCIIVGLGFQMAREAKGIGNQVVGELHRYRISVEEQDLVKYDGVTVYGTDVVNLMKKELSEKETGFCITVRDKIHCYTYKTREEAEKAREEETTRYIPPLAEYTGEVIRNENEVIVEVVFRKVGTMEEETK